MVQTRQRFKYQPRERAQAQQRADQSGGMYDSYLKDQFPVFKPKEGDFQIRFLPPTWPDPEHFGHDITLHYGVGADNQAYLCPAKMKNEPCVLCQERKRAEQQGDTEYAKSLAPVRRVLVWVVDRDSEVDGPKLWPMAWTVDRDFAVLSIDRRTGDVLCLDDPTEGYDVVFSRKGQGLKTKYIGLAVSRTATPLADEPGTMTAWLDFIVAHPLPSTVRFYDPEHVEAIFTGGQAAEAAADAKAAEEGEDEAPKRTALKPKAQFDRQPVDMTQPQPETAAEPVAEELGEHFNQPLGAKTGEDPAAAEDVTTAGSPAQNEQRMSADELFSLVDDDEPEEGSSPAAEPPQRQRIKKPG